MFGLDAISNWLLGLFKSGSTRATDFPRNQLHQFIGVIEGRVDNRLAGGQFIFDANRTLHNPDKVLELLDRIGTDIEFILEGGAAWTVMDVAIRKYSER